MTIHRFFFKGVLSGAAWTPTTSKSACGMFELFVRFSVKQLSVLPTPIAMKATRRNRFNAIAFEVCQTGIAMSRSLGPFENFNLERKAQVGNMVPDDRYADTHLMFWFHDARKLPDKFRRSRPSLQQGMSALVEDVERVMYALRTVPFMLALDGSLDCTRHPGLDQVVEPAL